MTPNDLSFVHFAVNNVQTFDKFYIDNHNDYLGSIITPDLRRVYNFSNIFVELGGGVGDALV